MLGFKKKTRKETGKRYYSDILVNEPKENWKNWGINVLDYTINPSELLVDRLNFQEGKCPLIKICGYVAGLKTELYKPDLGKESLSYSGMILLGENPNVFPLKFSNYGRKENPELEEIMLKTAQHYPITMIGRFYNHKPRSECAPYLFSPFVLEMGDYICPVPKAKEKENE